MGKRHPNYRLVKIHRNYSVEEIARLCGKHKNTVRAWLKDGLFPIDKSRPVLVHGHVLAAFLKGRRTAGKRPSPPGHLHCFKCREPKPPAEHVVIVQAISDKVSNISAVCPTCGGTMYRRASNHRKWVAFLQKERLWGLDDPLFPATRIAFGVSRHFEVAGLDRKCWANATPIRTIFRAAFEGAKLGYFNPHFFRKTLALFGQEVCQTPEEFKAWSQNLGHESVMTTFSSYGQVAERRQAEIIRSLGGEKSDRDDDGALAQEIAKLFSRCKSCDMSQAKARASDAQLNPYPAAEK